MLVLTADVIGIGYSNYHYPLYPLPSASGVYTPYTIPLRFGDISYMECRYRGSIEYRDTYGGVGIVVPISGIAQH